MKDEHVHPTLLAFMVVSCTDPEIFPSGEGGPKKTLMTFFKLGANIFQGRGSKFFQGRGSKY